MKQCTKCKINKELEDFVFKNKVKGIKSTVCKECQKAYKLKHYHANKRAHYKRNKLTKKRIKDLIRLSKTPCIICGESEKACIDFHHLRDKRETISGIANHGSIERAKAELKKCVCLCSNCHRKLHAGIIKYPVA